MTAKIGQIFFFLSSGQQYFTNTFVFHKEKKLMLPSE